MIKQKRLEEKGEGKSHSQYYNESKGIRISVEDSRLVPFANEEKGKLVSKNNEDEEASFELTDLLKASAEGLGKRIFGNTYKAMMVGGRSAVVVKRLRDLRPLNREEFVKQLEKIVSFKHRKLLPFLAYFDSTDKKFFIFKHEEKGNLISLLHGKSHNNFIKQFVGFLSSLTKMMELNRSQRNPGQDSLQMALQIISPPVAAQLMSSFKSTEYQAAKRVSKKSVVWTYGCLSLELLTGRMWVNTAPAGINGVDLCGWVHRAVREERTAEILDLEIAVQRSSTPGW
ncbi:hypothetical protein SLEP1_g32446 [Rubroshorea leprosula]|uniref:Serine-threonine/tyrosine-protein kinase catalytic domain-containing protein n=1 Tax=Rubroshorea leprosula TaxID=152421 RepID=A0AAV5KDE8_9ROSI|nr:hypothetical protein SLEP1_g32446 [Rubroshorea leprosula]